MSHPSLTFRIVSSLALPKRLRDVFGDSAPLPVDVLIGSDVELVPNLCGNVFALSQGRDRDDSLLLLLESSCTIGLWFVCANADGLVCVEERRK